MHRRAPRFLKLHFSANPLAHTPWWLADVPTDALERAPSWRSVSAFETRDLWRANRGASGPTSANSTSDDASRIDPRPTRVDLRGARAVVRAVAIGIRGDVDAPRRFQKPSRVPSDARLRVRALADLDVSHNELLYLPDVARLASLTDLRASGNRLQKLPDSLSACVSLRSLYAGQNPELDALPNLEPCVSLETLVVDRCALKVLPVSVAAAPRRPGAAVRGGEPADVPRPGGVRAGGNAAVLRFIRDVRRTRGGVAGDARAREAFRAGTKTEEKEEKSSLGALLWRATRGAWSCATTPRRASPRARGRRVRRRKRAASRARGPRACARRRASRVSPPPSPSSAGEPRSFPGTTCRVRWRRCGLCANARRSRDVCLLNSPRWPRTF